MRCSEWSDRDGLVFENKGIFLLKTHRSFEMFAQKEKKKGVLE